MRVARSGGLECAQNFGIDSAIAYRTLHSQRRTAALS